MYVELPAVTATPAARLQALKDAKELMAGSPETTSGGIFGGNSTKPRDYFDATEAIRVAEYITTGHDYRDTHPSGKRRPVIKTTNVTVVAPPSVDPEDLEHLLSHVEDGSFVEFMEDMIKEQAKRGKADDEESTTSDWEHEQDSQK